MLLPFHLPTRKKAVGNPEELRKAPLLVIRQVRIAIDVSFDDVRGLLVGIKDNCLFRVRNRDYPRDGNTKPLNYAGKVFGGRRADLPLHPGKRGE